MASNRQARARVRAELIEPLVEAGVRRPRRMTVEQLEAMFGRLELRLAYLPAGKLPALREIVEWHAGAEERARAARGSRAGRVPGVIWPDEAQIVAWAHGLEAPPARHSELVRCYMASSAGRAALDRSIYLAAGLHRYLVRVHWAPAEPGAWHAVERHAEDYRRRAEHLEALEAEGALHPVDARWLEGWRGHVAEIRRLVAGEIPAPDYGDDDGDATGADEKRDNAGATA